MTKKWSTSQCSTSFFNNKRVYMIKRSSLCHDRN